MDNEENGMVAVHMLFDLHKNFRPDLSQHAQSFLELVTGLYQDFSNNAAYYFGERARLFRPEQLKSESIPAKRSFQVVVETPLIIMFLCQVYKADLAAHLKRLVPLMVQAATCHPALPVEGNPALQKILGDVKWAQIKTIQFLTYLLKDFHAEMMEAKSSICDAMARLLEVSAGGGEAAPARSPAPLAAPGTEAPPGDVPPPPRRRPPGAAPRRLPPPPGARRRRPTRTRCGRSCW